MNVFELTRALVDIESVTNAENRVGNMSIDHLSALDAEIRRPRGADVASKQSVSTYLPIGAIR